MPAHSEKQANLFRAALGDPKPGTGAAKIKASMPREKIKHFTKVGESDDACESCGGQGWYADGPTDNPQQVQCKDCNGTGKKLAVGEGTMETFGGIPEEKIEKLKEILRPIVAEVLRESKFSK